MDFMLAKVYDGRDPAGWMLMMFFLRPACRIGPSLLPFRGVDPR